MNWNHRTKVKIGLNIALMPLLQHAQLEKLFGWQKWWLISSGNLVCIQPEGNTETEGVCSAPALCKLLCKADSASCFSQLHY